jgi:hypothetical protein
MSDGDFLDGDANGDGLVNSTDLAVYNQLKNHSLPNSPAAPTALAGVVDSAHPSSQIDLSWSAPATQADSYVLEQSTNGTNFTDVTTLSIAGSQTSCSLSSLPAGTQFWFRLRAVYAGVPGVAIASSSITTSPAMAGVVVTSAVWDYQDKPNALIVGFDQDVNIAPNALQMENATTGDELTAADYVLSYDSATHTATYTFPNQTSNLGVVGALGDGWWVATINADDITSADGSLHLQQNLTVNCPVLTADANHTLYTNSAGQQYLRVGGDDYNLVLAHFNQSANYAQGGFDYSGTVDGADYNAVLAHFNATLTAPPSSPGQLVISNDGTSPQTALDVNWSAPTPPAGLSIVSYKLQRSTDGETFTDIPQLPGGVDPDNIPAGTPSVKPGP